VLDLRSQTIHACVMVGYAMPQWLECRTAQSRAVQKLDACHFLGKSKAPDRCRGEYAGAADVGGCANGQDVVASDLRAPKGSFRRSIFGTVGLSGVSPGN
jgi:hypothetical protein